MTAEIVDAIRTHWAWTGIDPEIVTATSPFGHLIVRDSSGAFWYLDPEVRTLERIAADEPQLFAHMNQPDVREIWEAELHVQLASEKLGPAPPGRCYAFPIIALLEGDFSCRDFWLPPIAELIGVMGDIEQQLRALPAGGPVKITVVD